MKNLEHIAQPGFSTNKIMWYIGWWFSILWGVGMTEPWLGEGCVEILGYADGILKGKY